MASNFVSSSFPSSPIPISLINQLQYLKLQTNIKTQINQFFNKNNITNYNNILIPLTISHITSITTIFFNITTNTITTIKPQPTQSQFPIIILSTSPKTSTLYHPHFKPKPNAKRNVKPLLSKIYNYNSISTSIQSFQHLQTINHYQIKINQHLFNIHYNKVQIIYPLPPPPPPPLPPIQQPPQRPILQLFQQPIPQQQRQPNHNVLQLKFISFNTTSAKAPMAIPILRNNDPQNNLSRLHHIQKYILNNFIPIICLQESQLTTSELPNASFPTFHQHYQQFLIDHNHAQKQRGMYLAIHNNYNPKQVMTLTTQYLLSATFTFQQQQFLIINLYAPPKERNITAYNEIIKTLTNHLQQFHDHQIIICGDFNQDSHTTHTKLISKIVTRRLWRTTTGNDPITYSNTLDRTKTTTASSLDHVWYACNHNIQLATTTTYDVIPHTTAQHHPLITTIRYIPLNQFNNNINNQQQPVLTQPPLPPNSTPQETDILNKLYKIRNITKTTKFRRLCMLNCHEIAQSPHWSQLQTQLNQLRTTITPHNIHQHEQITNNALVLALNCYFNCINDFINVHKKYLNINNNNINPQIQQFSIWSKLNNLLSQWNLYSDLYHTMKNDRFVHFRSLSSHWSRQIVTLLFQYKNQQYQQSWIVTYNKYMKQQQKIATSLKISGRYKEYHQHIKKIMKGVNGESDSIQNNNQYSLQQQIQLRPATPFLPPITNPNDVTQTFATHLNNQFSTMLNKQQSHDQQIAQLEQQLLNPHHNQATRNQLQQQLDDIKPVFTQSTTNAASLDEKIKPKEIAYAIAKAKRFKSTGSDFIPIEFFLAACESNYSIFKNNDSKFSTLIQHKMKRKIYQNSNINSTTYKPTTMEQKFYSTLHDHPNTMLLTITSLFNIIFTTTITPNIWSISHIVMIPKNERRHDVNQYRPISIGSNVQKLYHSVLYQRLLKHSLNAKLISKTQTAYQPQRERFENLTTIIEYASRAITTNQQLWVVFVDLQKAFDAICHNKLIIQLQHQLPNANKFIQTISNLYNNLSFSVKYQDHFSAIHQQVSGIKQGDVLSPLLFLNFTQPALRGIPCHLEYADDLKTVATNQNQTTNDIIKLERQFNQIDLNINFNKTQLMVFEKNKPQPNAVPRIQIQHHTLIAVQTKTYLGMILNGQLDIRTMLKPINPYDIISHRKILSCNLITNPIKQQIINEQIYAKLFHNAPALGLLLTNPQNEQYFKDNISNNIDDLVLHATGLNNSNTHPLIAYSILQITPPLTFILTQTVRFLIKYNINSHLNPKLTKLIRNCEDFQRATFNTFINKILDITTDIPHTTRIVNDQTNRSSLKSTFSTPTTHIDQLYDQTITEHHIYLIMIKNYFKRYPTNPGIFIFNPKSTVTTDISIELFKHASLLKSLNRQRFRTKNPNKINQIENYIQFYDGENKHILNQLTMLLPQFNQGWNLIYQIMAANLRQYKYNPSRQASTSIKCRWCETHKFSPSHVLLKCHSAVPTREKVLHETKYIFHKYNWKRQFLQQQEFFHGDIIVTKIQQLQRQLLQDPKFAPIQIVIQNPFSSQSIQFLQQHDINLNSIFYPYWNANITTFMERTYNNNQIRTLFFSLEYKILYEHQFMYNVWSCIQYPDTLQKLETLMDIIMDGIKKKHLHRIFSFELCQMPYIVKVFIYIYLAIAAQTLI